MHRATTGLVVAFLLWSFPVHAQSVNLDDRIKSLSSLGKTDAEYRLGPGDLIEISVFGVENFRHTLRISASGVIKLPLLDPITAAGLTPAELEQRLTSLLNDDVIKNPQVSVFVKEYRSQSVYVLGAVRSPGQYQITLQLKIVDVISMAGGLQSNAVDEAVIQRRSADGRRRDHQSQPEGPAGKGRFGAQRRRPRRRRRSYSGTVAADGLRDR